MGDFGSMAGGELARLYHDLSSYSSMSDWRAPPAHPLVLSNFETDVLETFPAPCKTYPDRLPTVKLPRSWSSNGGGSATSVLAGRHAPAQRTPDLADLARLLHLSAGIVRTIERADGRYFRFRASGSAGGLFPLELYVSAKGAEGLADGVYWFDPLDHGLTQVGPPPDGEATSVLITGIPWRTGWRYAERALRHLYWDAGAMLANTLAVAEDAGLDPHLRTGFSDAMLTRLVGADGVDEFPLAIVTLGEREPAIRPSGQAAVGAVDRQPVEFPLITAAQHAGDARHLGPPRMAGAPLSDEPPASAPLDEVILRRISTRIMDPARPVTREVLEWSMAAALRGCGVPHFVAIHAVEDVAPGMYRWPSLDRPRRRGDLREELFRVCLDQELGRDAAFVVIGAADISDIDDRSYRQVQLEAGLVNGRLQLAASALGIGASGMTFVDADIPRLLGEPLSGLLFTCVGVPAYRHRPGGPPGAPTKMRPVRSARA